jgi:peptide/nickel transport system permease protein
MRLAYILRRLAFLAGTIWTAATLIFLLPKLAPRDPVSEQITQQVAMQGLTAESLEEQIASRKALYGLDRPLWEQYLEYLWRLVRLDLGFSIVNYPTTVNQLIAQSMWYTIGVVGTATVLAFVIGTVLGALLGWNKSPRILSALIPPLMVFQATPAFVIALILIYYLAFKAKLFPLARAWDMFMTVDWTDWRFLLNVIHHATLPALSLILVSIGGWGLGMRAMMVTVEGDDYMTFAEAKGLKSSRLFFQYALRNALLPQVTGLALRLGSIISGSTLVEVYFQYPGLGSRLNNAIGTFDYYVISGIVFIMILAIALAAFFVEMLYPLLDPRISYSGGA